MNKFEGWRRLLTTLFPVPWFSARLPVSGRVVDLALAPESIKWGRSKKRKATSEGPGRLRPEWCRGVSQREGDPEWRL